MNTQFEKPRLDVRCQGDNREFGMAIGSELKPKIVRAQEDIARFETFCLHRPWWMPVSVYQRLAQRRARWMLEPRIRKCYPHLAERIVGMAQGARTSVDFLYLFHALESIATDVAEPALAGCTAVAARADRTADRQPIVAHNFDLVDLASPLLSLRESHRSDGLRYLGFTLAPMAGVVDGINEAGLAITYDYAPTTDVMPGGPPISFGVDEALSTCTTVSQAAEHIARLPRAGGALLMLADTTGDIAALELSARHGQLRRPKPGDDCLSHSNAFQTPEMQKHELPRTAVYSDNAPEGLRNTPVFQSAERRDEQATRLLRANRGLSADDLANLMSDHGPEEYGSADTICMHGPYWSTLASVQLLPAERRLRVSYGPACCAEYQDFVL